MQSPVLTVQHCATKSTRMYTSSPPNTHFFTLYIVLTQSSGKNNFVSYLGFRQKYLEVQQTPFVWVQHSSAKGKQAVLLESLFKESDSRRVPPLSATANGESALSHTKTSQPRPFLHTRQKNAQGCSLPLPQTRLGMFGEKAEMTGTTIKAALFRENCLNIKRRACTEACEEGVVSRCRAVWQASAHCCEIMDFLK